MVAIARASIVRVCVNRAGRNVAPSRLLARASANQQQALAIGNPMRSLQTRNMSIFGGFRETVTSKMQERNEAKQAEAYLQQVKDLAYAKKFDLNSFKEQLEKNAETAGINGWKSYIPGVNEMTAVQQMKAFLVILESIEPEHMENPRLINGKIKRKISEKSGHSAEEINNMLRQYEHMDALHLWLVKRVERNLSLPETMNETQDLVREDPTGFPAKRFQVKRRRY